MGPHSHLYTHHVLMAYSISQVTATGSPQTLPVPPYIDRSHIKVFVDGVPLATVTWLTTSTISVTATAGKLIRIQRVTSPQSRLASYSLSSGIPESEAREIDSLQTFYLTQELYDQLEEQRQLIAQGDAAQILALNQAVGALQTRVSDLEVTTDSLSDRVADLEAGVSGGTVMPPVANFIFSPNGGEVPVTLTYTNTSTGTYASSLWTFMDANGTVLGTSTSQHPSFQWQSGIATGTCSVKLRVTGPGGFHEITKTVVLTSAVTLTPVTFTYGPRSGLDTAGSLYDTMLGQSSPSTNFATADFLSFSRNASDTNHILLGFDLHAILTADATARGGTVASFTGLTLTLNQFSAAVAPQAITAYVAAKARTAGQETWNSAATGTAWTVAGGDYGAVAGTGTIGAGGNINITLNPNILSNSDFLTSKAIILELDAGNTQDYILCWATDHGSNVQPYLTLTYQLQTGAGSGGGAGGTGTIRIGTDAPHLTYDFMPSPFANLFDSGRVWAGPNFSTTYGPLDASGFPSGPASKALCTVNHDNGLRAGVYEVSWVDASGTVVINFTGRGAVRSAVTRNGNLATCTVTLPANQLASGGNTLVATTTGAVQNPRMIHTLDGGLARDPAELVADAFLPHFQHQGGLRSLNWMYMNWTTEEWGSWNNPHVWANRDPDVAMMGKLPTWAGFFRFCAYIHSKFPVCREFHVTLPGFSTQTYITGVVQLADSIIPDTCSLVWEVFNENSNYGYWHTDQWRLMSYHESNTALNSGDTRAAILSPDHNRVRNDPEYANAMWFDALGPILGLTVARTMNWVKAAVPTKFGKTLKHKTVLGAMAAYHTVGGANALAYLNKPAQVAEFGPISSYLHRYTVAVYLAGEDHEVYAITQLPGLTTEQKQQAYWTCMFGGNVSGITFSYSEAVFRSTILPSVKATADLYGLDQHWYEFNAHSRTYMWSFDGDPQKDAKTRTTHNFIGDALKHVGCDQLMPRIVQMGLDFGVKSIYTLYDVPGMWLPFAPGDTLNDSTMSKVFTTFDYWGQPLGEASARRRDSLRTLCYAHNT